MGKVTEKSISGWVFEGIVPGITRQRSGPRLQLFHLSPVLQMFISFPLTTVCTINFDILSFFLAEIRIFGRDRVYWCFFSKSITANKSNEIVAWIKSRFPVTSLREPGARKLIAVSHKPMCAPIQSAFESTLPCRKVCDKVVVQVREIFILN